MKFQVTYFVMLITPIMQSKNYPLLNLDYRRQATLGEDVRRTRDNKIPEYDNLPKLTSTKDSRHAEAGAAATRFTTKTTTIRKRKRTTPPRISMVEDCDYLAYYCLKAYDTGKVCGRTINYNYSTFKNYCLLDYVNCMERYEVWQIVHMGECFDVDPIAEYMQYPHLDDYFLDNYYIIEDM